MKTLFFFKCRHLGVLLFGSLFFYGCPPVVIAPPIPPILVVMGADISKTFEDNSPLQGIHIRAICELILNAGVGGAVVFQTVGDPTHKDPLRLEINSIPNDCKDLPASARIKCKKEQIDLKTAQKTVIESFIAQCTQELQQSKQLNTDINGFFRKATSVINGPLGDDHTIFVYLHSDGIHDLKGNKTLNCSAIPQNGKICVSSWTNPEKCNIACELATPDDFILLLKKEIKRKSLKSKQQ